MSAPVLCWSIEERIGRLVIDDPPENATGDRFFAELTGLTRDVLPAAPVTGIIISGRGRHFSSGAKLSELTASLERQVTRGPGNEILDYPDFMNEHLRSFQRIADLTIPVVAAIAGVCIGSGLELALACHVRIAARGAVLGLPECTFGLMPGCGGVSRLTALTGSGRALEMILRGDTIGVDEALAWGVVDEVTERRDLEARARAIITALGPLAAAHTRRRDTA